MINFRYHVVSLTAIFLALAIGLVLGTAALNSPLADDLKDRVNGLSKQNEQYRERISQLEGEVNNKEQFASEAAPQLLADKLTGKRVLLVVMASADKYVDPTLDMLKLSGAKVSGQVEIRDKFTDPSNDDSLSDLAHLSEPPTVTGLPHNTNGVETSSALLGAVLLNREPPVAADSVRSVLSAYTNQGDITVTQEVTGPADAVIMLVGPPYLDREAAKKNANVLTMIEQFDKAGPIVVAGAGTGGDGNSISAVRGDPTLSKTVSTVDNVPVAQGLVATVLALSEQIDGRSGHYGSGDGHSSLIPKPATSKVPQ